MRKIKIINRKIDRIKKIIYIVITIFIGGVGYLSIIKNDYYLKLLDNINNTTSLTKSAPRGRIFDRFGNLLVDNKLTPVLYYLNTAKNSSIDEINIAKELIKFVNIDYSKVTMRNIKDYYLAINDCNYLITDLEWQMLNNRKITNKDIYNIKIERLDENVLNNLSEEEKLIAYLYYLMNGYSYEFKTIKKDNLTDKEISNISENLDLLPGFFIDYCYERVYLYNDTFKSILGNVSKIALEDKEYYLNNGYILNDLVGTSFIEKQYEKYLHGEKGRYKIEGGKIEKVKDSMIGKDIYLTIDIKLQQEVDKILETELINAKNDPNTELFNSVYVVIKEPKTGDILDTWKCS